MNQEKRLKTISICFFVLCILLAGYVIYLYNNTQDLKRNLKSEIKSKNYLTDQLSEYTLNYRQNSSNLSPTPSVLDLAGTGTKDHFFKKIYPQFPSFQKEVPKSRIKRVFIFSIPAEEDERRIGGYIVEVASNNSTSSHLSYYLITAKVQKELVDPMSGYADESGEFCTLTDFKIGGVRIANDIGLHNVSYNTHLILIGSCTSYGGGDSISLYEIASANKTRFKGNISIKGTQYGGISKTGNALGRLRGIFGYNNSRVVIEFGVQNDLSQITSFDLKGGFLVESLHFD